MSTGPAADLRAWGVGIHHGATDVSMPLVDLAIEAEDRGFDAVFLPEHTHIPVSRATPFPGGVPMPERYKRVLDPLVALSFVAARTTMVVGTCVSLPSQHDAIAHAKAVATLDHLSGGRFVMGVGFGWNREEAEDHGFAASDRAAVAAEKVALMRQLWTQEVASFEGEHVRLSPSWSWPKPRQRPHPPVLVGGRPTDRTFERILSWGDGWIPMGMGLSSTLRPDLERLRERWADAGRGPEGPYVAVMERAEPVEALPAALEAYRAMRVTRVLVDVPSASADVVLPLLDRLAPIITSAS